MVITMKHLKTLITLFILSALGLQFSSAETQNRTQPFAVGELLTITSRDVPETTKMVSYSLDHEVRGLLMQPSGRYQWSGDFLIPPSHAGKTLRPVLTYYLNNGSTMTQELDPIKIAPNQTHQPGVLSSSNNGRLVCLFSKVVSADTVRAITRDGQAHRVGHENNYFVLPSSISSDNVRAVTAKTIHGETVTLTPQSADVARL